jgi:predicted TIM-barrel fold metal-dependent hydrolase
MAIVVHLRASIDETPVRPGAGPRLSRAAARQVGVERVLYGSDAAFGDNLRPREAWTAFRKLPLTDREFKKIARNVAPYLDSLP